MRRSKAVPVDGINVIPTGDRTTVRKYLDAVKGAVGHRRAVSNRAPIRDRRIEVVPTRDRSRKTGTPVIINIDGEEVELDFEEQDERDKWHAIVHAVAELHRSREAFEEMVELHEVEQLVAEANGMLLTLNLAYGWEPGEPFVADRMFGVNVRAALGAALKNGTIDFRTMAMIRTMRSIAQTGGMGGRNRIASVAAVRNLVGGVTVNEAKLQGDERRLKADDFAELVGFADGLSRAEELAIAHNLGRPPSRPTARDTARETGMGWNVSDQMRLRRNSPTTR